MQKASSLELYLNLEHCERLFPPLSITTEESKTGAELLDFPGRSVIKAKGLIRLSGISFV
jgi:hypothetical protein